MLRLQQPGKALRSKNSIMSRLVSVDPGINGCAYAVWVDEKLTQCGIAKVKTDKHTDVARRSFAAAFEVMDVTHLTNCDHVAIEFPQVYRENRRGSKSNADPNDLLPLAAIAGALGSFT